MKFNWHDLHEGFLKWMVVNLITGSRKEDIELFEKLSKVTNKYHNVDMKITINGVEVPTDYFVKSVESNMDFIAKQEAERAISEYEPLNKFREASAKIEADLAAARYALRFHLDDLVSELGLEPIDYED